MARLLVLCCLFAFMAAFGQNAEIRWNELAGLIAGKDVTIPLPGGGAIEGEALSVRDDCVMVDIRRASEPARYPKGPTAIPRAGIVEIRVVERRGSGGRVLGSVVGALLGIVAGGEAVVHGVDSEAAGVTVFTATAVACTVGGYLAGRTVDRRTRVLRIAQPPAAPL
jgi:hypothetical protein